MGKRNRTRYVTELLNEAGPVLCIRIYRVIPRMKGALIALTF
jgi:hypothetical protein